jgi:hypothetical protein
LFLPGIVSTDPGVMVSIVFTWDCIYRPWSYGFYCFYLGLYLHTLELWFLLFLSGIVSTDPGVMVSIVFTWDCIYSQTITPGSVDTIPDKNNRNHNSRLCRYNPR